MAQKPTLKEQIAIKSERELQEHNTYLNSESEKHLRRISDNVTYFFWISIIGGLLWIILTFMSLSQASHAYSRY